MNITIEKMLWHTDFPEKTSKLEASYIDLLIKHFGKFNSKRILDLACGYGRLHPYLKSLGYEIVGIDNNPKFIEEAFDILKRIFEALKENGILVLDHTVYSPKWKEGIEIIENGKYYITEVYILKDGYINLIQKIYRKYGEDLKFIKKRIVRVRLYHVKEIVNMLKLVGFSKITILNPGSIYEYQPYEKRAVFIGKKA